MARENNTPRDTLMPAAAPPAGRRGLWLAVGLALVMGAPAIRGGFVGGDDHRLVINHVLVNHPSLSHAVQLFTVPHRDLYQPLPLLTFSIEFAICQALGFFDGPGGAQGGAWLFHLTNMLLHALNTWLVWLLVRRIAGARTGPEQAGRFAAVAAVLFAVHPLQGEVVAWVNGRMMLLSTLFAVAALLVLLDWLGDGPEAGDADPTPPSRWARAGLLAAVCALTLLSAVSKIRAELPLLAGIVALAARRPLGRRFWLAWTPMAAITALFVWVNVQTTAEAQLFTGGAETLEGPRAVRVLLALAFYVEKLVLPLGLCSYYPTPPVVTWSDATTWRALAILAPAAAVLLYACLRSTTARLATAWTGLALAPTLPLVPARNVLAADRYAYLPMIGAVSLIGLAVVALWPRIRTIPRAAMGAAAAALLAALTAISWWNVHFYNTPLLKTLRVTQVFPDTPRVWTPLGWVHLEEAEKAIAESRADDAEEHFREAIACAERELLLADARVRTDALQLLGMIRLAQGDRDEGLARLHEAVQVDTTSAQARYRLAAVLQDLGETGEALRLYEEAIRLAPGHNAALARAARLYRAAGRSTEAAAAYEQAIENNPYEVSAILGLSEIEIEAGDAKSLASAIVRLEGLLSWMPQHVDARVNLGVALGLAGQPEAALAQYEWAIAERPSHARAWLHVALLLRSVGDDQRATAAYATAAANTMDAVEALAIHDGLIAAAQVESAESMWRRLVAGGDAAKQSAVMWAQTLALLGRTSEARPMLETAATLPDAMAGMALAELADGRYDEAVRWTDRLIASGESGAAARDRFLTTLQAFEALRPSVGWTYHLVAQLTLASGQREATQAFIELFEGSCADEACRQAAAELRRKAAAATSGPPAEP